MILARHLNGMHVFNRQEEELAASREESSQSFIATPSSQVDLHLSQAVKEGNEYSYVVVSTRN